MSKLTTGTRGASNAHAEATGLKVTRAEQVRRLLAIHGPLTRRELHDHSGIEIATLCAALNKLEREDTVWVQRTKTCDTTGREVAVYQLTSRKGTEE